MKKSQNIEKHEDVEASTSELQLLNALNNSSPDKIASLHLEDISHILERPNIKLTQRLCAGLDMFYKAHFRSIIHEPKLSEIEQLIKHLAFQLSLAFAEQLQNFSHRYDIKWAFMKEILADQRAVCLSLDTDALLHKSHVMNILTILYNTPEKALLQQELQERLEIGKHQLSNLLSKLSEARMIKKNSLGRNNIVKITDLAIRKADLNNANETKNEIDALSKENTQLSEKLAQFETESLESNKEIRVLNNEIRKLNTELRKIRKEKDSLKDERYNLLKETAKQEHPKKKVSRESIAKRKSKQPELAAPL